MATSSLYLEQSLNYCVNDKASRFCVLSKFKMSTSSTDTYMKFLINCSHLQLIELNLKTERQKKN